MVVRLAMGASDKERGKLRDLEKLHGSRNHLGPRRDQLPGIISAPAASDIVL